MVGEGVENTGKVWRVGARGCTWRQKGFGRRVAWGKWKTEGQGVSGIVW